MAANFPNSFDSLTNPQSTFELSTPSHATEHANLNDIVEAIQQKVGLDGSGVSTSLDYRVSILENTSSTTGVAETGSSEPVSPVSGQLFFDTNTKELKVYYNEWWTIGGGISGVSVYDAGSPTTASFEYIIDGGSPSSTIFSSSADGGSPTDN